MNEPASTPTTAAVGAGSDRYLTFLLGGELYALPILQVVEILEYRPLTTVPTMPADIRGVLNLRGSVVPVVDLALRFRQTATEAARRTSIVIVDADQGGDGSARTGILVDAVNKVLHVSPEDIQPLPELTADGQSDVIAGMARHGDQFIVILNLTGLLDGEDLRTLEQFAGEPEPVAAVGAQG